MALVALEPHESSTQVVSAGTYAVLVQERLRAMLGRQRGNAANNVLREVCQYMTQRQVAGMPIGDLDAPFKGFTVGPTFVARGYSVEQLLNAAVRTVSAFGSADDLLEEEDVKETPRNTVRTTEFLRVLKRYVAGDDKDVAARFEKTLSIPSQRLDVTVDYAFHAWMVQVTSLPATPKQVLHSQREAQSKLYEIDKLRRTMDDNKIKPVLLVNEDVLSSSLNDAGKDQAAHALDRLTHLAKADDLELMHASTPREAARLVISLD